MSLTTQFKEWSKTTKKEIKYKPRIKKLEEINKKVPKIIKTKPKKKSKKKYVLIKGKKYLVR